MLHKLTFAVAVGAAMIVLAPEPGLSPVSEAHAFSLKKTVNKAGKSLKKAGNTVVDGVESVGGETIELGEAVVDAHKDVYNELYVKPVVNGAKAVGAVKFGKCALKGGCARIGPPQRAQVRDHRD